MKKTILLSLSFVMLVLLFSFNVKADITTGTILKHTYNSSYSNDSQTKDDFNTSIQGNVTNGTYSSNLLTYNFSSTGFINYGTLYSNTNFQTNLTITTWIKPILNGNSGTSYTIIAHEQDASNKEWSIGLKGDGTPTFSFTNSTLSTLTRNGIAGSVVNNSWNLIIYTINRTNNCVTIYVNNQNQTFDNPCGNISGFVKAGTPQMKTASTRGTSNFFNGSIKQIIVFNRVLSSYDIEELFYLGVNGTGNQVSLFINFSSVNNTISNDHYGLNTRGTNITRITLQNSSTEYANDSERWLALYNSGIKNIRHDNSLNTLYLRNPNTGFEKGTENSLNVTAGSYTYNFPFAWEIESVSSGTGLANWSTENFSGSRSLYLSNNNTGKIIAHFDMDLNQNNNYTFKVILKSNNVTNIKVQERDSSTNMCSVNTVGTGNWINSSECNFNVSTPAFNGYRFVIEVDANESGYFDEPQILLNGNEYIEWKNNLTDRTKYISDAINYGIKVYEIIAYMPNYFANYTSECSSTTSRTDKCSANDTSSFANIVLDYYNNITLNGSYTSNICIDIWNEPDISFFLPNLASTSSVKQEKYNSMYNAIYDKIISVHPTACIGGASTAFQTSGTGGNAIISSFIGNASILSYNFSFIGPHYYVTSSSPMSAFNAIQTQYSTIKSLINNEKLFLGETGNTNENIKVNYSQIDYLINYAIDASWLYTGNNITKSTYEFTENSWFNSSTPGSTYKYVCWSEQKLNNEQFACYNETSNITKYHVTESKLYNYNTSDEYTLAIASNKSSKYNISIMNSKSISANYTLFLSNVNPFVLSNSNGSNHSFSGNVVSFNLNPNSVNFFELLVSDVSFSSLSPSSVVVSVDAGESQLFSYSLYNIANLTTIPTWYVDGINTSSCYNMSSCTFSSNTGDSSQTFNVSLSVYSSANVITTSWSYSVIGESEQAINSICYNSTQGLQELSGWLATIALVIGAVVVIGAIKLYSSGMLPDISSALGVGDLGTVAILLVGSAITISIAVQIVVSAIC